jgi:predicted nucleic acid-binding OB-fold protein
MADFDINSIDDIDMNYDFGFTTVDEDEVQEFETAVQAKVAKATQQETGALEAKMDKLLKLREDDSSYQVLFEKRKAELEEVYKEQMKNPENEYIKWPNRTDIVQKQINKIVALTRGV